MYDKVSQTYFSAEETLQKGDIVILCGRKLEMIVDRNSGIVGTPHRVVCPSNLVKQITSDYCGFYGE